MTPADLKPGHLYRLTQDVENPSVDKRSSNPMRKRPVFTKGTTFVCLCDEEFKSHLLLTHGEYRGEGTFTVAVNRGNGFEPSSLRFNAAWAEVVMPHLESLEIDSWNRLQIVFGFRDTGPALRSLWEDGTITWERVLELLRTHTPGSSQ